MEKIKAEGLKKKFKLKDGQKVNKNGSITNEVEVLNGVDLSIIKGEFLTVVGPSGCGKSVLLDIIGGLTNPTSGNVYLDNKPIVGPSFKTGYVFQQYALFPWRNALSNIEFGLETHGIQKEEREKIARKLLSKFGLSDFEDRFPYQLSGGMQQRVAIARSLATNPDVLLMDEPFAALDAQTREILQNELLRIWEGTDTTVIFVTHSIDEAVFLADRVAVMTARPGVVKQLIDIDLERPRNGNIRSSNEFARNRHKVWDALKDEVLKAQKDWELASVYAR
ncbi:MAG: sulfonate ABC transporter ATP-binding protein [Candidatus Methanoperedens nitroreducens]|uniref:Sulfonate ABC transporter ATP-binding protein n=1 Tax=Candidatus Methanoperedens nitratireducens TaxID=1392998 RepID=A0A0P8A8E0_9EURY|nr:ABC transporter ATP-binding protein [Candidatus Methanoperedens sp. BLZ2]KAB2947120.1 MAG: ABC transporter ATP-binding protein [Candidatus Methanoperedens sp.]KPQ42900.1 MAG: sulfonate ABC transporter ATP-binding protein [Candidatus Methanoperedens sp. BLZ1]CAG0973540.1 sulfonate transport system ATP-binding protein [Methanosarcinales archaeon]MCX9077737.1 ABC transporter ATP-binding protein [Candidatus Methanoperedens sp.]MCX9086407.1 ABC transporter ATP-binding protein [Candidatus Methano